MNRRIISGRTSILDFKGDRDLKQLKAESVVKAKELYTLYQNYDLEYFKSKVMLVLSNTMVVYDVLQLYESFDYFKKLAIEKVYDVKSYQEVLNYCEAFSSFANNPSNVIVTGIPVFSEEDVPKVIINKYRLENIKIEEANLRKENISNFLSQIKIILRLNQIDKEEYSVQKIWFLVKMEEMLKEEKTL